MMCPHCGANSAIIGATHKKAKHHFLYARQCDLGHKFMTAEVHLSQLADKREFDSATHAINLRILRFNRDAAIRRDARSNRVVAEEYGLTEARVRQIRARLAKK